MSQRLPVPGGCSLLALVMTLAGPAAGQELTFLAAEGGRRGKVMVLETALDMERGFDRRTLVTLEYPDNREHSRDPLLAGRRARRLAAAGDWELFRALEDRSLDKAVEDAGGYSPVVHRRNLRAEGAASFTFTWGDERVEVRVVPGRRRAELVIRRTPDGPERRLARILPAEVAGPGGPVDMGADALLEAALLGGGRVLAVVVGAWNPEGGRRIGWERVVLLPLRKTARLWDLSHPLEPVAGEWRDP